LSRIGDEGNRPMQADQSRKPSSLRWCDTLAGTVRRTLTSAATATGRHIQSAARSSQSSASGVFSKKSAVGSELWYPPACCSRTVARVRGIGCGSQLLGCIFFETLFGILSVVVVARVSPSVARAVARSHITALWADSCKTHIHGVDGAGWSARTRPSSCRPASPARLPSCTIARAVLQWITQRSAVAAFNARTRTHSD
jgi:hypothetical protein